jgi:F0F1-type ATP synthase membrane subunit c/vacuolar-type H+-ATPase subunit K
MRQRLKPEELHARLIVVVGVTLALVFAMTIMGFVYALMFVTQPIGKQAPNDAAFIDLLSTLTVFMTGTLSGLVASNGLKSKAKDKGDENEPKG